MVDPLHENRQQVDITAVVEYSRPDKEGGVAGWFIRALLRDLDGGARITVAENFSMLGVL